jgi:hypothetical protein
MTINEKFDAWRFDAWRLLHKCDNSIGSAQRFANEVNLVTLQALIADQAPKPPVGESLAGGSAEEEVKSAARWASLEGNY